MNNKNISHIDWQFPLFYSLAYSSAKWSCHGYHDYFLKKLFKYVVDALIVLHCVILRIDVFGMHIGFIILQVSTIMEVPSSWPQIKPCLK
ncbi:hypothetical protein K443DRAFT_87358 [Laccaria amethystina LaAM-08-1]|jgi:hypothetical protein|uniref:Unplaced genomic scaffold K443scaffold_13, whole genome shotgun sequence n=1 Tax=Laccaria amethystina LaAM-08-1 TaxID=1095629 RepID=A0A0C9XQ12_9AGAR|nr:hypothetical protein K443DRAFT_87358 [Laccaria amethystina LaAM-08-1]